MSPVTDFQAAPDSPIARSVAARLSRSMSPITVAAPSPASRIAVARPMLPGAPTITATGRRACREDARDSRPGRSYHRDWADHRARRPRDRERKAHEQELVHAVAREFLLVDPLEDRNACFLQQEVMDRMRIADDV